MGGSKSNVMVIEALHLEVQTTAARCGAMSRSPSTEAAKERTAAYAMRVLMSREAIEAKPPLDLEARAKGGMSNEARCKFT